MAAGDLYRLVWKTTLNNQPIQNRFFYLQTAGTGDVNDLMSDFETDVLNPILGQLNDSLVNVEVLGENLDDPTDFGSLPLTGNGAQIGDALPAFVNFYVRLNRGDKTFRYGRKALAGVSEADQNNGVIDPARLFDLQVAFDVLDDNIVDGAGNVWQPVLARNISAKGDPPVYIHTPITGTLLVRISSQNTRKDFK